MIQILEQRLNLRRSSNKATLQLTIPRSLFKSSAKDLSPETLEFAIGSALDAFAPLAPWNASYVSVAHLFSDCTKFDIKETKAGLTERRINYGRPLNGTSGRPLKG